MSEAFDKGRDTEREVATLIRKKLKVQVQRDSRSGAGLHKADIRDYYQEIPLFIECKDQETLKVKEWMRQTIAGASFNQTPTLVFRMDSEGLMAVLPFADLLNFLLEIKDLREEVADLRLPVATFTPPAVDKVLTDVEKQVTSVTKAKIDRGGRQCRNGHLTDDYGYCMQLDCKFSRGYRPKKVKT